MIGDGMKRINMLQLIASICLLTGSIINLLNIFTKIPFEIYVFTVPLFIAPVVLYSVVLIQKLRTKKNKKEDNN